MLILRAHRLPNRITPALAAMTALSLASCEPKPTEPPVPSPSVTADPTATVSAFPATPLPSCSAKPPSVCVGPLVASLENVTLQWASPPESDGDRDVLGTATLVLSNGTAQPVYAALLRKDVTLKFANGTTLKTTNDRDVSGISICGWEGPECVNSHRESFSTLSPGDSPVRIEVAIRDSVTASAIPSLANATTGSLAAELWVIHNDPAGNKVSVSIGNATVANSTAM